MMRCLLCPPHPLPWWEGIWKWFENPEVLFWCPGLARGRWVRIIPSPVSCWLTLVYWTERFPWPWFWKPPSPEGDLPWIFKRMLLTEDTSEPWTTHACRKSLLVLFPYLVFFISIDQTDVWDKQNHDTLHCYTCLVYFWKPFSFLMHGLFFDWTLGVCATLYTHPLSYAHCPACQGLPLSVTK